MRFTNLIEELGGKKGPLDDAQKEIDGGLVNRDGYPITAHGRPDWCGKCGKLEEEYRRLEPSWRPSRVVHERGKRGEDVALALCAKHQKDEKALRDRLAAEAQEGRGK